MRPGVHALRESRGSRHEVVGRFDAAPRNGQVIGDGYQVGDARPVGGNQLVRVSDAGDVPHHAINNRQLIANRIWIATFDSRTCGSCLAQHGTEWPVEAFGPEDHQQGRCTFIDRTIKWADIDPALADLDEGDDVVPDRDDWWGNLSEGGQNATLGKAKADLLRDGKISWADLSTKRSTPCAAGCCGPKFSV